MTRSYLLSKDITLLECPKVVPLILMTSNLNLHMKIFATPMKLKKLNFSTAIDKLPLDILEEIHYFHKHTETTNQFQKSDIGLSRHIPWIVLLISLVKKFVFGYN